MTTHAQLAVEVDSGRAFATAFTNLTVSTIFFTADIFIHESDWEDIVPANTTPFERTTNVTIQSMPDNIARRDYFAFNGGYVKDKVKLGPGVVVTMHGIVLTRYRDGLVSSAPGLDLFAKSDPPATPALAAASQTPLFLMINTAVNQQLCFSEETSKQSAAALPSRGSFPGVQLYNLSVPQPGCVPVPVGGDRSATSGPSPPAASGSTGTGVGAGAGTAASVPWLQRCWAIRLKYIDVAVPGAVFEPTGRVERTNYWAVARQVDVLCDAVATPECVAQLGPLGCYQSTLFQASQPHGSASPPPPGPLAAGAPGGVGGGNGGSPSSAAPVGVVVGAAVGAACVAALVAGAAVLLYCRRGTRRRSGSSSRDGGVGDGGGGPGGSKQQKLPHTDSISTGAGSGSLGKGSTAEQRPLLLLRAGCADAAATTAAAARVAAAGAAVTPGGGGNARGGGTKATSPAAAAVAVTAVQDDRSDVPLLFPTAAVGPATAATDGARTASCCGSGSVSFAEAAGQGQGRHGTTGDVAGPAAADDGGSVGAEASEQVILEPSSNSGGAGSSSNSGDVGSLLGKGAFGKVVHGLYKGRHVAVKLVHDAHAFGGPSASLMRSFTQEVEVLGRCRHPNVVQLLAACLQPPRLCLVMELMEASLAQALYGPYPPAVPADVPALPLPPLAPRPMAAAVAMPSPSAVQHGDGGSRLVPLQTVLHITLEVAKALEYLHPTVPGNVLLNDPWGERPVVKITDFGLSRLRVTAAPTLTPDAGTPAYLAPECLDASAPGTSVITHRADIYSLGIMTWEMLAGSRPWRGFTIMQMAYKTSQGERPPLHAIPEARCPPRLRALINAMWDPDPKRRPAAAEVVKLLMLIQQEVEHGAPASDYSHSGSSSAQQQRAASGVGSGCGEGGSSGPAAWARHAQGREGCAPAAVVLLPAQPPQRVLNSPAAVAAASAQLAGAGAPDAAWGPAAAGGAALGDAESLPGSTLDGGGSSMGQQSRAHNDSGFVVLGGYGVGSLLHRLRRAGRWAPAGPAVADGAGGAVAGAGCAVPWGSPWAARSAAARALQVDSFLRLEPACEQGATAGRSRGGRGGGGAGGEEEDWSVNATGGGRPRAQAAIAYLTDQSDLPLFRSADAVSTVGTGLFPFLRTPSADAAVLNGLLLAAAGPAAGAAGAGAPGAAASAATAAAAAVRGSPHKTATLEQQRRPLQQPVPPGAGVLSCELLPTQVQGQGQAQQPPQLQGPRGALPALLSAGGAPAPAPGGGGTNTAAGSSSSLGQGQQGQGLSGLGLSGLSLGSPAAVVLTPRNDESLAGRGTASTAAGASSSADGPHGCSRPPPLARAPPPRLCLPAAGSHAASRRLTTRRGASPGLAATSSAVGGAAAAGGGNYGNTISSAALLSSSSSSFGPAGGRASRAQRVTRAPLQLYGFAEREGRYKKRPRDTAARAARQAQYRLNQILKLDDPRVMNADLVSGFAYFAKGLNSIMQQFVKWAEEDSAARDAVDKASRIIQAGSLGHGTQVTEAFDVDLLVLIREWGGRDLSDLAAWQDDKEGIVTAMRRDVKDALQKANPGWAVSVHNLAHYRNVLLVTVGDVAVDLLLLPDCVKATPPPSQEQWAQLQWDAVMRPVIAHPDTARYGQVRERAASPAFVELLSATRGDVKDVIRFVKGLYKLGVYGGGGAAAGQGERIRSISLEVLVLAADQRLRPRWAQQGRRELGGNTYKLDLFLEFLRLVVVAVRKREVVMLDAGPWGYSSELGERCRHNWDDHPVRIICPWDPTCNLERDREHRGRSDWGALADVAQELLDLLLFDGRGTFADFERHPAVARALGRVLLGGGGGDSSSSGKLGSGGGGGGGGGILARLWPRAG
ncbi:hypothetical protein HXX76_015214 [Chlamydomonas incerta]|uniref:Protein kinase domain-containing protein n=1 Tax=Chlamydomonas incerta TaxID=51695 RepID=A0A835SJL5_CHLIN|nr:hypothetical protein HXX76_015214 [Chlamydomonas incerta]|eukprot:KAG2423574.1 hypothetical protein HXX76_015214 [Chlamydomonas incerta]